MFSLNDLISSTDYTDVFDNTEWYITIHDNKFPRIKGNILGIMNFKFNKYEIKYDEVEVAPNYTIQYPVSSKVAKSVTLEFLESDKRLVEDTIDTWIKESGIGTGTPKPITEIMITITIHMMNPTKDAELKKYTISILPPLEFSILGSNTPALLTHNLEFPIVTVI